MRIFVPKREKVVRGSRRLHKEELHNLYTTPNFIRVMTSTRMRWTAHVAGMGETRDAYKTLIEKSEGKRSVGRQSCRWGDNIKMGIREIVREDVDWIRLVQDKDQWRAVVNTVMNLPVLD
jgi:hypothetical protein